MASVEDVITELKKLRPDQVDEVAQIIHDLSQTGSEKVPPRLIVPARVVDEAILHGWPAELFTEVIGRLAEISSVS
ncbi:MAG: hypothetical protein ACLPY2_03385 [Bryobacteraceae bacterium]|jgi:hypothetical protein